MIYIHVGFPKTGSTFLQREVFEKLENYSKDLILMEKGLFSLEALSLNKMAPARLKKIFPDARIIIIKRDPYGFIESLYKQHVHSGGVKTFKEYFKELNLDEFDQDKIIACYKTLFKEVYVDTYEHLKAEPHMFIARLFEWMGEKIPPYKIRHHNRSYCKNQIEIARFLNRFLNESMKRKLRRLLQSQISFKLFGTLPITDNEIKNEIENVYRQK